MKSNFHSASILVLILAWGGLVWAQNPGDIVVTEIMQNPAAVTDQNGEWFEIYNITGSAIDIDGWTIEDNGSNSHTISGTLVVPANGFLVLCKNSDSATNGHVNCDYQYSSFFLANTADEVILETGAAVVIDRVEYDGGPNFPNPDGASMFLTNFLLDNNVGSNWSTSISAWPRSDGDSGSPGELGDATIAVELSLFTASVGDNKVVLNWITQTETENLGFHLFRVQAEDGDYVKITPELIPGAGTSVEPHSYSYIDRDVEPGHTYYYKLADIDFNGNLEFHGPVSVRVATLPTEYALAQNYPNPFNPHTTIRFSLPEAGSVTLVIYNMAGQRIRTLVSKTLGAGHHSVLWSSRDDTGERVASGVYVYRLEAEGFVAQKKLVLTK